MCLTPNSFYPWNRTTLWISWDLQWKVSDRIILKPHHHEKRKKGLMHRHDHVYHILFPFPLHHPSVYISAHRMHVCKIVLLLFFHFYVSPWPLSFFLLIPLLLYLQEFLLRKVFRYLKHVSHCWLFSSLIYL